MILDDEKDELQVRSSPRKQSKVEHQVTLKKEQPHVVGPGGDH